MAIPETAPEGACPTCLIELAVQLGANVPSSSLAFEPPSAEELSARFGELEVLALLGSGGMGAVYRARQKSLDRLVAVKILPPERAREPRFAERFLREAKALARLNHPHIVAVYDAGQADDYLYIVMEYVEGISLRELIQDGRLEAAEALRLVPQICAAMQYAHDHGVIHRDIKPENLLLDQRGDVKIADFGLAKLARGDSLDYWTLTDTNMRLGTLHYMAPEQKANTSAVDHRADIYSLGVMFYEMLTGELPTLDFKPPSHKTDVDPRVDSVVARSIKNRPEERYQQAVEVKWDVERIRSSPRARKPLVAVILIGLLAGVAAESLRELLFRTPGDRPTASESPSHSADRVGNGIWNQSRPPGQGEFASLFDLADLREWELRHRTTPYHAGHDAKEQPLDWIAENNVLVSNGNDRGAWLATRKTYRDFNLTLEWRVIGPGDTGVSFRVRDMEGGSGEIELVLNDEQAPQLAGSLRILSPNLMDRVFLRGTQLAAGAPGEWNATTILCQEDQIKVEINGLSVISLTQADAPALADLLDPGPIALKNHGSRAEFRSIRIQSLDAADHSE